MTLAIKKEMVFGLLLILLLVLFILNMSKQGHTGSKFSDLLGDNGITIVSGGDRNAIDLSITYKLPAQVTINGTNINYYKWPLLYLIDANNTPGVTPASLNSDSGYLKPPPSALLNSSFITYGTGDAGTTGYYAPSGLTVPVGSGNYFPNLINLTNLYSSNPLTSPTTGAFPAGESLTAETTGTWVIPGNTSVISAPLINGRSYILGVSAQLVSNYVNLFGNTKYQPAAGITRRYGNFTYFTSTYNIAGLSVVIPGAPSGSSSATMTLQI